MKNKKDETHSTTHSTTHSNTHPTTCTTTTTTATRATAHDARALPSARVAPEPSTTPGVACRSPHTHPPPTYRTHHATPYRCPLPRRVAPSTSPPGDGPGDTPGARSGTHEKRGGRPSPHWSRRDISLTAPSSPTVVANALDSATHTHLPPRAMPCNQIRTVTPGFQLLVPRRYIRPVSCIRQLRLH